MNEIIVIRGDFAQLKSGGPILVITEIKKDKIVCNWAIDNDDIKSAEFHPNTLTFFKVVKSPILSIG